MENTCIDCCSICGSKVSLFSVREKWICETCIDIGNKNRTSPWKNSIEKLFEEYSEACYKSLSTENPEEIHQVRVIGRKIRSVLQFIGLPKKHPLLYPITEVHLILNKLREADVFMDDTTEQNEENIVNEEMVKLLSEKQKEMRQQYAERLPILINDSYYQKMKKFVNEELISYVVKLKKEMAFHKYEEQFNQLVEGYYQLSEKKEKTSENTVEVLHYIRKKAKSLRYVYTFLDEVFGEKYQFKVDYYKVLQRRLGEIIDLDDRLMLLKTFEKEIDAPKKDVKAMRSYLKRRLKHLIDNIDIQQVPVK